MSEVISRARSRNYLHQVKGAVVFKGMAMATSFVAIPLMIHYLGQEQFGVWSTLLSVMTWVSFFDLGLGNGLRNKLAESLARDQLYEAQRHVSSAYSLIGIISLSVFLVLVLVDFLVDWQVVFNTHVLSAEKLRYAVLVAAFFITLNFWVSLINAVLSAVQKTSFVVMGQFMFNVLSLILVYILSKTTEASLLYLATVYGISLVGANVLLSAWFYKGNRMLFPKLSLDFSHARPLLNLGLQFFAIQVAVLIIYATSKILIAQLFGPTFVTQYEVVFKLFSIITLLYGLITAPLWSSYTDAYHRDDIGWIKRTIKKQIAIFGVICIAVAVMVLVAKPLIYWWVGGDVDVSMMLVFSMGGFVLVSAWTNIFASFLNGVGKIKVSVIVSLIAMFLNVPASILLAKYTSLDASAVVIGTIVALLPGVFTGPYQTYRILNVKDAGIWGL